MKEKIGRLSKGIFDYDPLELLVSEEAISFTVETGKSFHGSFRVYNAENKIMKGLLYSSSSLFILKESIFIGSAKEIAYEFKAEYLEAGTKADGYVSIVSECGEKKIKFNVKVLPPVCVTSIGELKSIHLFAELVKENKEEAGRLFLSSDFKKALSFYDGSKLALYDALTEGTDIEASIEEFITALGLKERVLIAADKYELEYDAGYYNFVDYIKLHKDNWGYAEFFLSSDSSFIETERKRITSNDFINDEYEIPFIIKADKQKTGIHTGKLTIESIYQSIEISITCRCTKPKDRKRQLDRKVRMLKGCITKNYIKFRTNQISAVEYVKSAEKLISDLRVLRKDSMLERLYHVHLLYVSGKAGTAVNVLAGLNVTKEKNTYIEYAAGLYLKVLLGKERDGITDAVEELRGMYMREESHWLVFFVMLYLNKRYETDIHKKYDDIKEYVLNGCTSPVIYYEAASLLIEEPSLMRELGVFEQKILSFMIKYGMYAKDIAISLHSHTIKIKKFNNAVYYILKRYYEKYQMKELLLVITAMLIRGHKADGKYFIWYQRAIKDRLKLAELPEYYLAAAKAAGITELDSSVYTYFSNSKGLDANKRSWLYYSLILSRTDPYNEADEGLYGDLRKPPNAGVTKIVNEDDYLEIYKEDIKFFVMEQLGKKRADKELSLIYKQAFKTDELVRACVQYLPDVMFMHEITCYNKDIKKVLVIHDEITYVEEYMLGDGRGIVNIYSDNAELVFVDNRGCRYGRTVKHDLVKLFQPELYIDACLSSGTVNDSMLIWMCGQIDGSSQISSKPQKKIKDASGFMPERLLTKEIADIKAKALGIRFLKEQRRQAYIWELIEYHFANDESVYLEKYLLMADFHYINGKDKDSFIECLLDRNMRHAAVKMLSGLSYEGISGKSIKRLSGYVLGSIHEEQKNANIQKELINRLCWLAFKAGSMETEVISYLSWNYQGTIDEMYDILTAARELDIDAVQLEERLIAQHLFTGSPLKNALMIFLNYYQKGLNKTLIKAFLSKYSYMYLVSDITLKPEFFKVVDKELGYEENEVCLLAYLKNLSRKEALDDGEIQSIDYHMDMLTKKGILLPFFKDFARHMRIPSYIQDKSYIEYCSEPSRQVKIYYAAEPEGRYIEADMRHVCYGIYVYEFVLFYGESIYYYITDDHKGKLKKTERMKLTMNLNNLHSEELFYHKLNKILEARSEGEESAVIEGIENYIRLKYAADRLFKAI